MASLGLVLRPESGVRNLPDDRLLALTAEITSAFVRMNRIAPNDLPALMRSIYASLTSVGQAAPPPSAVLSPAVPIKRSVTPDFIICLEDGKRLKSMKRYLRRAYGLTPEEYRAKWGLPKDYPMTSPNYSAARSTLAISLGLGRVGASGVAAKRTKRAAKAG